MDWAFATFASFGKRIILAAAFSLALAGAAAHAQQGDAKKVAAPLAVGIAEGPDDAVHPVKVSDDGRYFIDQTGKPVFWLGTTQWELFRGYSLEDARIILAKTKEKGFAFVQVMLMGVGDGTRANVYGETPWIGNNPLTPNEAYFRHVDAVVAIAQEHNLAISMTVFHQRYREHITVANARAWGKWIADRYKDAPGIVWSMTPVAEAASVPVLRELIAGLREGHGGGHLITAKPDPAPYSSSFMHAEGLLDFHSIQTWAPVELIYPMVGHDYALTPVTPVLMAEGSYEQGSEYGYEVTPLWIRRQAYYSYLAGGHHAYGHNDSWRILPTWRQALDSPGATQLSILKRIFLKREEWWQLVPDQSILTAGGSTQGRVLTLAARHRDGKWIMVYWGGRQTDSVRQWMWGLLVRDGSVSVRMDKLAASTTVDAIWIDPRSGDLLPAGRFTNRGVQSFSVPRAWEDAILLLEGPRK
ncbi:MAG: DUF4038 domain-containing protein [Hyphomicrobiaceae bacterium]